MLSETWKLSSGVSWVFPSKGARISALTDAGVLQVEDVPGSVAVLLGCRDVEPVEAVFGEEHLGSIPTLALVPSLIVHAPVVTVAVVDPTLVDV